MQLRILAILLSACSVVSVAQDKPAVTQVSEQPAATELKANDASAPSQSSTAVPALNALPDAPSAVGGSAAPVEPMANTSIANAPEAPATRPRRGFWISSAVVMGSSIANAELILRCRPTSCQSVPDAIRNRPAMYVVAISGSVGVSYLSYQLKKSHSRFWYVPIVAATAANVVYSVHAAQWSR